MKWILILFLLFPGINKVFSQEISGHVQDANAYVMHKMVPGETLDSVALLYGVKANNIRAFNNLKNGESLQPLSSVKIPIADIIVRDCSGSGCIKVYYEVQAQEGLYRIGKNFGNISGDDIRKLNDLNSNGLSLGQRLLVGYLHLSNPKSVIEKKPTETTVSENVPIAVEPLPVHTQDTMGNAAENIDTTKFLEIKSFFESEYKNGTNEKQLHAGTFKSESGWNDGRFYVLVDHVPIGTILKIENSSKGTIIFAKVVGPLPEINTKDVIQIRISNAGASALKELEENNFDVMAWY